MPAAESAKKEIAPDGGKDENVFDIMVGTSIAIFVKRGEKGNELARVHYVDLWGRRKAKFAALDALEMSPADLEGGGIGQKNKRGKRIKESADSFSSFTSFLLLKNDQQESASSAQSYPPTERSEGVAKRCPIRGAGDIKTGRVYINAAQYFDNVPESSFNFFIGGYQPAQKWLKDRKGRTLTNADLTHYRRLIATLTATSAMMDEIG